MKKSMLIIALVLLLGLLIAAFVSFSSLDQSMEKAKELSNRVSSGASSSGSVYKNRLLDLSKVDPTAESYTTFRSLESVYYSCRNQMIGTDENGNSHLFNEATILVKSKALLNRVSDTRDEIYVYEIAPGVYSPYTADQRSLLQNIVDGLDGYAPGEADETPLTFQFSVFQVVATAAIHDISMVWSEEYQFEVELNGYKFYSRYEPSCWAVLERLANSKARCSACNRLYVLSSGCLTCVTYADLQAKYTENIAEVTMRYAEDNSVRACSLATFASKAQKAAADVKIEQDDTYCYEITLDDGTVVYSRYVPYAYMKFKLVTDGLGDRAPGEVDTSLGAVSYVTATYAAYAALYDVSLTETEEYSFPIEHDGIRFYSRYTRAQQDLLWQCATYSGE